MQDVLHNPLHTKNETRAYLAGVFDGEGCVVIDRFGCIRGVVCMTVTEPLLLFQSEFGGSVYKLAPRPEKKNQRKLWRWQITGAEAAAFFREMIHCLRVKQIEALLAYTLYDIVTKGWKQGQITHPEYREIRKLFKSECEEMKRFNA